MVQWSQALRRTYFDGQPAVLRLGERETMFNLLFTLMPIFIIFFIGVIAYHIVKSIAQWNANNNSPVEEHTSRVVAKREHASQHHHHHAHHHHVSTSTTYYVTFELSNGLRKEFSVRAREYGMLVEGDRGMLRFQGTRYLEFARGIS